MTYRTFLKAIETLNAKWFLTESKEIVRKGGVCPWLEVIDVTSGSRKVTAADGSPLNHLIWAAADNRVGHDPQIREDLLRVCKLTDALGT